MPESLRNEVAYVTGAASGIGKAIVDRFVSEGARVVALDVAAERLENLQAEFGRHVRTVHGDVRSEADNEKAVQQGVEAFGRVTVFVGNAGVFDGMVPLSGLALADIPRAMHEIFDVNVLGYLLGARASLEQLRRSRGCIVLTVSNQGLMAGCGGGALYTASKHAVVGVVRQLAHELAPEIRVNGVAPGGTITDVRVASSLASYVRTLRHFSDPAAARDAIAATNPLRVVPEAADHASLYVLLASREARAVTGEVWSSDGGLHVRGLDYHPNPRH